MKIKMVMIVTLMIMMIVMNDDAADNYADDDSSPDRIKSLPGLLKKNITFISENS